MSGSCHSGSVETVVKVEIFVFFSFSAEKKATAKLCILGHLQAIKVPDLKGDKASNLKKSDLYSFRSDFCSAENLKENKDSKFDNNFNTSNMT